MVPNPRLMLAMRLALALTWFYQGTWLKLIVVDPHHLAVTEALGPVLGMSPRLFLSLIGAGETLLGLGVLSGLKWRFVAFFQIGLVLAMNAIGIASGGVEAPIGLLVGNLPLLLCMVCVALYGPGRR